VSLDDYRRDIEGCSRCSSCKWVPFNQIKSWRFAKNCPSIYRHNFHTYSGSGRMVIGLSLIEGRAELDETIAEIIFRCQLCGACDSACKTYRDDIDISEVLLELRAFCVESGELLVEHMAMIDAMKREGNTLGEPKDRRGDWAQGLDVKDVNTETCDVLFHAGCRYSYDPDARDTAMGDLQLLRAGGLDVGIAGREEACCGGRAYELGYRGEASNYADDVLNRVKSSGASMLVTACADCYSHFRYIYPKIGQELPVEVLHVSQVMERLLDSGRLRFRDRLPLSVTYHDPCHLGRKGEPFAGIWEGDKLDRPMSLKRSGRKGIYDAPRNVLGAMPGVELVEMERIREYAWCCGAGGGVLEAFPDFAASTTVERIDEALSTGAEALVTACPWCLRVFKDAVAETSADIAVYDLADLALMSAGVAQPASV
jgi:heterodisulfide reductase subunit D